MSTNVFRIVSAMVTICLLALHSVQAQQYSDTANQVAWSPSYAGSCVNCQLSGQSMSFWSMEGANFPGADITRARLLGVKAKGANFSDALAEGANFRNALLEGASFVRADLKHAILIDIQANTADFTSADMTQAELSTAKMVGTTFATVIAINIKADHADFSGANVSGTIFDGASLRGAIFDGATLYGTSFQETDITGASFRDARFGEANIAGMRGVATADFAGACSSLGTQFPPGLTLPLCGGGVVLQVGKN